MKKLASFLAAFFLSCTLANAQFTIDQITQFGNSADQVPAGMSISNGSLYIAGSDAGQSMVLKYGVNNITNLVWNIKWPGASSVSELFGGVAADADGVYVSGYSYSQTTDGAGDKEHKPVLCKFPINGATGLGLGGIDWIVKPMFFGYKGYEHYLGNLLLEQQGTSYIYSFGGAESGTGGNITALLTKHDTNGNMKWQSIFGDQSTGIQGYANAMCLLNNNLYIGGCENHFNIWKIDLDGNKIWSKQTESTVPSIMMGICASDNYIYGAGYETIAGKGNQALIIKYDEDGNIIWKKVWGGALEDMANGIEIIDNTLWVVGETSSYGSGGKDAFILKLNATDGSVMDSVFGGGPQDDAALKILKNGQSVYISGTFQGTATFGPMTLTSNGGKDVFLMKMNSTTPTQTIQVNAGNLSAILTPNQKATLTTLKLSGTIDARDFKTMRDSMPMIETLDMSQVSIVSYTGTQGTRGAANTYYPENTIPRNAFYLVTEKSKLTTVIQPSNLTAIGRAAYNLCSGLTTINWPSGLTSIGYGAFYNCRSLKEAVIPSGVTAIDTNTFRNCYKLTSVTIPPTVKEIRYCAFLECNVLASPNFLPGSQLTHIGYYAFGNCHNFNSFNLPLSVSFISIVAFLGTKVEFNIPNNHPYYASINGVLYDKALKILLYCPDTKTGRIDIPPTVTTIAVDAFYNCSGLDSISIPSSLQIIDYWAFENCTGLRTLSIPASVNQINAFAFYNCSGLKALYVNSVAPIDLSKNDSVFNYINKSTCTLYVLSGLKAHYQAADKWKEFANIVEISDAVAVTPGNLNRVFSKEQRASMKRLSLKGSIDARDFKTMRDSFPMLEYLDLSAVTIVAYTGTGGTWSTNETVYFANKTPESAFFNPNGNTILSTVILPINLINVGRSSFNRCYNLKTIIIPPTVTTLERLAFYSCNKLFNITIPTSVTTIGYGTFIGCGFSTVTIPNGVKVLGDYAFQNCNNLEQVLIPASVDSIGFCTFTFNIAMKSFVVDGGNPVFSSFEGVLFDKARKTLVSYPNRKGPYYKVPEGVEVIDTAAFEGCYTLYSVVLPSTLTKICLEAFYECNSLYYIEIPASVNKIEPYVFYNCKGLTTINARPVLPVDLSTSTSVFAGVDRNKCLLRVPSGSKAAYSTAGRWSTFIFTTEDLTKQVTINAGGLYSSMTADELKTVTHLKITGTIDARDFKTMRESMGRISEIDIRDANILAYTGSDGTLFEWATYEANAIPTEAFYFRNGAWTKNWFSKILFPTSLTKIGYFAFAYSGLRSITLHEGITRIGGWAFHGCMLNTIALPASLTTIEDWALGANTILSSFTVAPGNPNFSTINGCLYDKSAKTLLYWPNTLSNQAIIPEGTETIWTGAFQGCDFINFINIPTSLKNIVAPAFVWTSNMWRFEVTEANPYFSTIDGVLYDKSKKKLLAYPNQKGTNYDIPNGVTEIGIDAFGGCWNLTSVNIPTSVTKISNNAFYSTAISRLVLPASINTIEAEAFSNCGNLKAITVNWKYPVDISNAPEVFSGMDKSTCALRVPQGTTGNYRSAAQWGEFNFIDEIQSVTYHVRVPAETKACYIAGEMNGWGQQPMIKENNNVYSITLNAYLSDQYKYFSGPDWSYEEMDTAHNVINNRDFSPMDTVRTWLNVYQPLMPYSPWNIQSNPWFSIGKIQFVSETEGWVTCGGDNSLLHSTDGGLIWNKVVPFPNDHSGNYSDPAISMDWVNPSHGWAIKTLGTDSTTNYDSPNGAVMYSTSDGGGSWARKALPKTESTITYNDADLQGVWQVHEIFEGNYQNLETFYSAWGHLKLTVGTNGQCLLSDNVFSSGSWSGSTAEMHVASNGVISMKDTNLKGFLNMDKNTGIFTIENETSSNVFGVMQRQVPNVVYQTSDLAGTWQMHMLNVDNPQDAYSGNSGWVYAIATVDVTGNAQLNIVTNNGDINSANTQFSITSDGFVSMAGMDWHGFMNADKTAYYSTFTNDGGKSYALCVMQKQKPALTYDVTELEGSWVLHEIMVANTNLMNPEGRINVSKVTIQKDGSGILTSIQNRNNDDNVELKLAITSSGLVSEASGSFRGFLNADKNTLTYTRNDPAGYAFGVLQRDSSYSGDVGLQVQFADENTGWASTFNWKSNGFRLYRSINGGTDWNLVPGPRSVCIFDFVDANNGWAISGFPLDTSSVTTWSIEHTTDGGLNWTTQYSETVSSDYSFNALQFTDLNNGWITGDNGKLLKTVDGGLHWTPVTIPGRIMNSKSKALFFLDANTGWITDENKMDNTLSILHTTDGGANWTTQNTNLKDGSLVSLYFWDVNHGWFTGEVTMDFGGNMINQGIIGRLFDGGVEIGPIKSKNTVSIYPNPVKDGFYIRSVEPGSMVTIYNLNGTAVLKQIAEDECYVDVKDLKKGMYLVRISNSSGVINKKIVKL